MNKTSKMLLIILLLIIVFFIGIFGAKIIINKAYINQSIRMIISFITRDKHDIKIDASVNYDNPSKRSEFHVKKAIKERYMYVFYFIYMY